MIFFTAVKIIDHLTEKFFLTSFKAFSKLIQLIINFFRIADTVGIVLFHKKSIFKYIYPLITCIPVSIPKSLSRQPGKPFVYPEYTKAPRSTSKGASE